MHSFRSSLLLALLAPPLLAQQNAVPGTDINLYDVGSSTIYGRRGPAYPGGEVGLAFGHSFCNAGTVHVPWQSSPTTSGQMTDIHFKIAFLLARESNGRIVQVSTPGSHVKHSRVTYNLGSSQCGTCQSGPGSTFRVGCYDAYSTGFNGDRFNLGPSIEIDPWLGSWNPVGSYFDRGDPMVGGAAATDGTQSLTSTQVAAFDAVKNRVTAPESELSQAGTFYGQVQVICEGEPVANRSNNLLSDRLTFTWNGTSWSTSNAGGPVAGSVLTRWVGATGSLVGNGTNDGRFYVAVKVTGPVSGFYHYEYAVHNIDNFRGGAALRLPLCAGARVQNIGFRDNDQNPLNDWTSSVTSSEIAFLAAAGNAHRWNQLFNFWFDCDVAPTAGNATLDQADPGPGALSLVVPTQVPQLQPTVHLAGGCGTPAAEIFANGVPAAGNAAFAIHATTAPATWLLLFFSANSAPQPLGSGCTLVLDSTAMSPVGLYVTDGAGGVAVPIPVAPGQSPADLYLQAATFIPSPPLFGLVGLSNGLKVRFAGLGCN